MGRACSTHGRRDNWIWNCFSKSWRKETGLKTCVQNSDNKTYLEEMVARGGGGKCGLDLSGAGWGPAVGCCCKHSNELFQGLRPMELVKHVHLWWLPERSGTETKYLIWQKMRSLWILWKLSKSLYPFFLCIHFHSDHLNVTVILSLSLFLVAAFLFVIMTNEPVQWC
jgi:hypothetical protein